jgi:protoheme ferro-lyase
MGVSSILKDIGTFIAKFFQDPQVRALLKKLLWLLLTKIAEIVSKTRTA